MEQDQKKKRRYSKKSVLIFSNQDKNYDLGLKNYNKLIKCIEKTMGKDFNDFTSGIGLTNLDKVI